MKNLPNWIYNQWNDRKECPIKINTRMRKLTIPAKETVLSIKEGNTILSKKEYLPLRLFYMLQEYMSDNFISNIDKEIEEVKEEFKKYKSGKEVQEAYIDAILTMWETGRYPTDIDPMLDVKLKERFVYIPVLIKTNKDLVLTEDYLTKEVIQVPHKTPEGEEMFIPVVINEIMPIDKNIAIAWFSPGQMVIQRELIDQLPYSPFKLLPNKFYQYLLTASKERIETKAYVGVDKINYLNTLKGINLITLEMDDSRVELINAIAKKENFN